MSESGFALDEKDNCSLLQDEGIDLWLLNFFSLLGNDGGLFAGGDL